MRYRVLLISSLIASALVAQDWALINPAYKYNYSLGGTDTITNQIFVTQIDTLGVDSFRYGLNRIGLVCDTCGSSFTATCSGTADPMIIQKDRHQFLGWSILHSAGVWMIEASDTATILVLADVGASWSDPDGSMSSVVSKDTATILGSLDSVKWIGRTTGDTLLLSKEHGVVGHSAGSGFGAIHVLIGRGGPVIEGRQFPTAKSIFDYGVGDVLQYSRDGDGTDGINIHFISGTEKYEILSRMDQPDTTTYSVKVISSILDECFEPLMWTPCGSTWYSTMDTTSFIVVHDQWVEGSIFNQWWSSGLWPGAVGQVSYPMGSYTEQVLLFSHLDTVGRWTIEQTQDPLEYERTMLCGSDQDTAVLMLDNNVTYHTKFIDRVGLGYENVYYFEGGYSRILTGYLIYGIQVGTITSDGVLLGVGVQEESAQLRITPNPASSTLLVQHAAGLSGEWSIRDMSGRALDAKRLTALDRETIDVSALVPGAYLFSVTSERGSSTQRFIIAR